MEEVLNGLGYLNLEELNIVLAKVKAEIARREEIKRLSKLLYPKKVIKA